MSECSRNRSPPARSASSSAGTALLSPIRPKAVAASRRTSAAGSLCTSSASLGRPVHSRCNPNTKAATFRTLASRSDTEPAAGVYDEKAAVGVLEDVGRVEVRVGRDEEVLVPRAKACAVALDDVALDLVRVEVGREKVVGVLLSERRAPVAHEAGGR